MELPINWPLIRNPLNWLTILLMVSLAGFVVNAVVTWQQRYRDTL